mmetsp:Transcript_17946/g.56262  ORF Transcript_17946/g.56262 Transcript_17946/m.56262 type:complete len:357 (+) Transcript_17946:541-1611(+)
MVGRQGGFRPASSDRRAARALPRRGGPAAGELQPRNGPGSRHQARRVRAAPGAPRVQRVRDRRRDAALGRALDDGHRVQRASVLRRRLRLRLRGRHALARLLPAQRRRLHHPSRRRRQRQRRSPRARPPLQRVQAPQTPRRARGQDEPHRGGRQHAGASHDQPRPPPVRPRQGLALRPRPAPRNPPPRGRHARRQGRRRPHAPPRRLRVWLRRVRPASPRVRRQPRAHRRSRPNRARPLPPRDVQQDCPSPVPRPNPGGPHLPPQGLQSQNRERHPLQVPRRLQGVSQAPRHDGRHVHVQRLFHVRLAPAVRPPSDQWRRPRVLHQAPLLRRRDGRQLRSAGLLLLLRHGALLVLT